MANPYITDEGAAGVAPTPAGNGTLAPWPGMQVVPLASSGKVKPILFIPLGRDCIRDSWVFNCLADIIGQGWARIKTEANATDIQRNQMGEAFLHAPAEFTHVVTLDSDHRHTPETVRQLIQAAEEKPDAGMIVGMEFRRRQPYDPCVWVERDGQVYQPVQWEQGLIGPLFRSGLAAAIIPRTTFQRITRPWFANTYTTTDSEIIYKREDFYFCDKIRKAGLEIWCDTRITGPHEPNLPGWVDGGWWRAYLAAHPNLVAETLPLQET